MAFKFVMLFATLAVANAGVIQTGWQPQATHGWQAPVIVKQPAAWQPQTTIVKQPAAWQPQTTIIKPAHGWQPAQPEAPANYEFNYEVHDVHTGDIKRQHEVAKDGAISGQYSLVDPDGYRRIVTYTADDHHGFQANVQREPVEGHKVVHQAPVVTKVIQPATVTKVIQPVHKVIAAPATHGWQQPQGWQQNPWG